jgi:hypothetical protein
VTIETEGRTKSNNNKWKSIERCEELVSCWYLHGKTDHQADQGVAKVVSYGTAWTPKTMQMVDVKRRCIEMTVLEPREELWDV